MLHLCSIFAILHINDRKVSIKSWFSEFIECRRLRVQNEKFPFKYRITSERIFATLAISVYIKEYSVSMAMMMTLLHFFNRIRPPVAYTRLFELQYSMQYTPRNKHIALPKCDATTWTV